TATFNPSSRRAIGCIIDSLPVQLNSLFSVILFVLDEQSGDAYGPLPGNADLHPGRRGRQFLFGGRHSWITPIHSQHYHSKARTEIQVTAPESDYPPPEHDSRRGLILRTMLTAFG